MHNQAMVFGLFDAPLQSWQGHWGASIQSLEFARSDAARGFVRGAKWALSPAGGPLRTALPVGRAPVWGPEHHRYVRERFGRSAVWDLLCEDLPDEANRVELSRTMVDSSGISAPKVIYSVGDNTRRAMEWNIERARESLYEAGAWQVEVTPLLPTGHLMGTARMGDDPRTSVVDRFGFAHDIPNLVIVDGSIFVTSGSANPTSTIVALALRAAEELLARRDQLPSPERVASVPAATVPGRSRGAALTDGVAEPELTVEDVGALARLADEMIPGVCGMPGADDAAVRSGRVMDVLALRPDLVEPVTRGLRRAATLSQLSVIDSEAYTAITFAIASAYYLDDSVRRLIGYPGQLAQPVSPFEFPEYVADGLLPSAHDGATT
jgi:hypothetical protein